MKATQRNIDWDNLISPEGTMTWIMPDNTMDNDTRDSVCKGDIIEFYAEKLVPDPIKETLCFITYMQTGETDCRMVVAGCDSVALRPLNPNNNPSIILKDNIMLHKVVRITRQYEDYFVLSGK